MKNKKLTEIEKDILNNLRELKLNKELFDKIWDDFKVKKSTTYRISYHDEDYEWFRIIEANGIRRLDGLIILYLNNKTVASIPENKYLITIE